ncbi:MAG: nucleoside deaminase [Pseudomonadota bacterium]
MLENASYMEDAFQQAKLAALRDEVPVGAVIVHEDKIIAADGNRNLGLKDPTAHAEILTIRRAARILGSERLTDCDLYVTLEPCPMCAAAISFARIRRLYFGASDEKSGGVENGIRYYAHPTCHHKPEIYAGIMGRDCSKILKEFFENKR